MIGNLHQTAGLFDAAGEKYVEGLRRSLARFDRHRPWLLVISGTFVIFTIGLCFMASFLIQAIAGNQGLLGLVVGLVMGFKLGFLLLMSFEWLVRSWFGIGVRETRLLIHFHDALRHLVTRLSEEVE